MSPSVAVVPAAGAAERFGAEKLLAPVGDSPLITRTLRSLQAGGVDRLVVVIAPGAEEVRKAIATVGGQVDVEVNRARDRGMFSTIQIGVRAARGDPMVVHPGDMPYVAPATISTLLSAYREREGIISPRYQGKRGHPVLIPARLRDEIVEAKDGETLHDVLRRHASERTDIDVADKGVLRDVDVPADLEPAP